MVPCSLIFGIFRLSLTAYSSVLQQMILGQIVMQPASLKLLSSQLVKVCWHLCNLGIVMILKLFDEAGFSWQHEVDCGSFSSEPTRSSDSMNIVLFAERKFIVDYETNLLDINTSSKQVCGNEYSHSALSELLHDDISLLLLHFSMHA